MSRVRFICFISNDFLFQLISTGATAVKNRFVSLHRIIGIHHLPTDITGIGEIPFEMFRLQMVANVLSGFVSKVFTDTAHKFLFIILNHYELVKVFRICNITS